MADLDDDELLEALESDELIRVAKIEFAAVPSIAEMELAGVKLDVARWKELVALTGW